MELIGHLQARVMDIVWKKGQATVHDVHQVLNAAKPEKPLAYTTVLTVMRNLARRKIVSQVPQGRAHIFQPLVTREAYLADVARHVRDTYFGGDGAALAKAAVAA
jgi:BlaI family penicillinase repressor